MIDADNYIVAGDNVIAVPKSIAGTPIQGRVLEVVGQEIGRREFILETDGSRWLMDGALGLPENLFLFEVERGDAWVQVPGYLLPEEAEAKVARSLVNTRKRIEREVPLFSNQIHINASCAVEMISRISTHRRETLEREHQEAIRATELRAQVQSLVTIDQFATLTSRRTRFPRAPLYGIYFWKNQLLHIQNTGQPDIYVPPVPVCERLKVEWLKPDNEILWLSAAGPRRVRVLYVGSSSVMVKILGQSITDYDPRDFPFGNTWTQLEELGPLIPPTSACPEATPCRN